ncbi:MAG: uroporphyrinogen decarboxylase [Firmicutes bacterium]|jgi:uroporphyrinogen decarboxylase|nr:uroporphyrinogen decarboxylase [Bacillota bacterium]
MDSPDNSRFIKACLNQPVDRTPVWFMRQAGRSLPEYRLARGTLSILETVKNPELAAELTLQPVKRYDVDAAVLFSDIMVPLKAIGLELDILPNVGPVIEKPFAKVSDLDRIRKYEPEEDAPYVQETIALLKKDCRVPIIGFAGAPFTIASYLVEGKPSRNFIKTKTLMHTLPEFWSPLMDKLSDLIIASLSAQITAGVHAIQLFDSWAGSLSRYDYQEYVWPFSKKIFDALTKNFGTSLPKIHFGVGTSAILDLMASTGPDVLSVDWRIPLDKVSPLLSENQAIQGNLDPAICLTSFDTVAREAGRILRDAKRRSAPHEKSVSPSFHRGHIFNLGHGVLPETDPDTLTRLVDFVRNYDSTSDDVQP